MFHLKLYRRRGRCKQLTPQRACAPVKLAVGALGVGRFDLKRLTPAGQLSPEVELMRTLEVVLRESGDYGVQFEANGNEMPGPTSKPFAKAIACAGVVFVAVSIVALAKYGPLGEGIDISFAVGCLLAVVAIPAVATGYFARRSTKVLSFIRIFATYIMFALVIFVALQLLWLMRPH
jgi:hypothetical protein